jgi:hypothetical protein
MSSLLTLTVLRLCLLAPDARSALVFVVSLVFGSAICSMI